MSYYENIESQVRAIRNFSKTILQNAALQVLNNNPLFDIEVASICNIACAFCPRESLYRQAKTMTPEVFDLVLKMLPDNAIVMFAGLGEALLNKHLATYISRLKKRNISSCIVTNGILLTPKRQEQLIASGIDQFQISYSGVSEASLKTLMGSAKHKDILDANLLYLATHRTSNLRVQLNFVLSNENASELPAVNDLAKSWGFDVYIRRVHNRGGHYNVNQCENNTNSSCGTFAAVTFITTDGMVLACSNDASGDSHFEYIGDVTWEDILVWKRQILLHNLQFKPCLSCNDDYRWLNLEKSIHGYQN